MIPVTIDRSAAAAADRSPAATRKLGRVGRCLPLNGAAEAPARTCALAVYTSIRHLLPVWPCEVTARCDAGFRNQPRLQIKKQDKKCEIEMCGPSVLRFCPRAVL